MSEQAYGQEATESAAGNFPIYKDAPPEDVLTPSDAAEAIAEPRPEEKPTIVRDYIKRREDGVPVTVDMDSEGNPLYAAEDPHGYVTAEEAARDLAATRQAEADALKQAENFEAQKLIDSLRGQQPVEQPQPAQVEQFQQQRTHDQMRQQLGTAISELDAAIANQAGLGNQQMVDALQAQRSDLSGRLAQAELQHALENPTVLQAVQDEIARQTAEHHAAAQRAYAGVQKSLRYAAAAAIAQFPELAGVDTASLPMALQVMQQSNPERHAAAMQALGKVTAVLGNSIEMEKQISAQRQQDFQRFAAVQDNKFSDAHPELADKETARRVSSQAADYLKSYGLSEGDISALWHTPVFRSAEFQNVLYDAMRYREAKAAVPKARANPVTQVQRPGSSMERDLRAEHLPRMPAQMSPKEAARYLVERRAATRR